MRSKRKEEGDDLSIFFICVLFYARTLVCWGRPIDKQHHMVTTFGAALSWCGREGG
jgi:hypothetical protein